MKLPQGRRGAALLPRRSPASGADRGDADGRRAVLRVRERRDDGGTGFGAGNAVFVEGPQMFVSVAGRRAPARSPRPSRRPATAPSSRPASRASRSRRPTRSRGVNASIELRRREPHVRDQRRRQVTGAPKRSWNFSGFIQKPGKPIYGHFRNGGRTYANYRFGVPKGRCGTLRKTRPRNPDEEAPHGQVADPGRLRAALPQEHEPAGHVDDDRLHDVRLIRT